VDGRFHHFDSVRDLERCCRRRYRTLDVHSCAEDLSFWVKVGYGDGRYVRLLIVHLDGSRAYVIELPEPDELAALLDRPRGVSAVV